MILDSLQFACNHPATLDNAHFSSKGFWYCRECSRNKSRDWYRRNHPLRNLPVQPLARLLDRHRPLNRISTRSGVSLRTLQRIVNCHHKTVHYSTADAVLCSLGMRVEDIYEVAA